MKTLLILFSLCCSLACFAQGGVKISCTIQGDPVIRAFAVTPDSQEQAFEGDQAYTVFYLDVYPVEQPHTYMLEATYLKPHKPGHFMIIFSDETLSQQAAWVYGYTGMSQCHMNPEAVIYLQAALGINPEI